MSRHPAQTLADPALRSNMPLFDGTAASSGLLKPPTVPGFLGKQTLQYNGAYFTYDPRGKDGAGFTQDWSKSKMAQMDDRSPVRPLSGMQRQNHVMCRQDAAAAAEEGRSHPSPMCHPPAKQGFTFYSKSPEISSPAVATSVASVAVRKQKLGAEDPSPPSPSPLYLAIPKAVYGHHPCCNDLGCAMGQRFGARHGDHVSQRTPNAVYEHDWLQMTAHYEKPPVQRKEALLQQRSLQLERGAEQLKRMTMEPYGPGGPNYASYPCAPTRTLFGPLSEHGQHLQTSPPGYPGLYSSHPTYEQMTSELYQERSPMSKYGQLTQHPVFYYSQANGEVENRQCKDSGSKQGENVSLLHKRIIPKPLEHYVLPQSVHAEIPLSYTEMLQNPSFMRGFDYPYYAVPRFHLNASQIRASLERQHSSPASHPSHIKVSSPSQHVDLPTAKDKPTSSLHADQLHSSSPFLHLDQSTPTRCVKQPPVSPSSIQMSRVFLPFSNLYRDAPVLPPAGINRLLDFSTCKAQAKQPKSLPVSHAAWQSQSPSRSAERVHAAVPNGANARKIVHSPVVTTGSKHNGVVSNTGSTVKKRSLKRSISHSSPPIKIEEEDKDVYEVELSSKQQRVEMETVKQRHKISSPPMPVIDNVFSLAHYQMHLQSSGVLFQGRERVAQTPEQHEDDIRKDVTEKRPDYDDQQPALSPVSKETSLDSRAQEAAGEVFKPQNIKIEKDYSSDVDDSVVSQNEDRRVIVKMEPEEASSPDSELVSLKERCDSEEPEKKPTKVSVEKGISYECNRTDSTARVDSSPATLHQAVAPQPTPSIQPPEGKVDFKNIPPHYLKLSTYKIIIPDGKRCATVALAKKPCPQAVTASLMQNQERETPVRKHFLELHHSLCKLISKSVSASSEQDLKNWLSRVEITAPASKSSKVEKVSCLLGVKAREAWLNEEMSSALRTVLGRLKEYTSQERCPFPHVMRTGAVFLPMLVVKELLFPMVQGSFVDQVLQLHKVELRPTTLSEEKILIQLHKRACSSRLRRLMSLKHLPDIYADVVNLLYYTCVCKHLGLNVEPDNGEPDGGHEASSDRSPAFSDINASPVSPSDWQRPCLSKRKSRVTSSSRCTFLDDFTGEEEAGDEEETVEGVLKTFAERHSDVHETEHVVPDQDPSTAPQSADSESSWMCPLMLDEPSPGEQCSEPRVKSKNCSGVILKLRKMFGKGLNGKKTCYQAVSESGADGPGASGESDPHVTPKATRRWQRHGFSHGLRRLGGSSKKKRTSLLKIKYCPYLSARHGAEHRKRWVLRSAVQRVRRAARLRYPDLVGKRVRHLYEEADKSEVWYRGEVLRVHEDHANPLKTIYEVRYDSEPEWKYYLELLMDYRKGWLIIED
ncbi:uncharacterized protein C15orf39 homolog [Cololabis saira]|uniref:uncharacterized protein C15orf39 homolog n=1 Tax=Cololabis saira TaxID=129043 RepID=UPI002AD58DF0|nr:uncharacterized protein C15orf39 homolog [Cololabis saira]